MSSDRQNATIYAGDNAILKILVTDEAKLPLNLTNATFTWILAPRSGAAAVVTKTITSGDIVVTSPKSGGLSINITSADTTGRSGALWHQLVMQDANGNVSTVMTGTLTFKARS